jgi:hypothetical protein
LGEVLVTLARRESQRTEQWIALAFLHFLSPFVGRIYDPGFTAFAKAGNL